MKRESTLPRLPNEEPSDIPIPLTQRTVHPAMASRGPTFQSPSSLGDGYSFDRAGLRDVIERRGPESRVDTSFIPGPPPLPGSWTRRTREGDRGQDPFRELTGIVQALRTAGARDEILELVLTGARIIADRVALFVVKRGGYLGWAGSPEFADRTALESVLIPLDANSVFDRAIREDVYVGPVQNDQVHASLLRALRSANTEIAVVPIRVSGKTAVIIVAADLDSPTLATRRLEDLARAGGDAFARVVRTRR
jgi:hypothetical protein